MSATIDGIPIKNCLDCGPQYVYEFGRDLSKDDLLNLRCNACYRARRLARREELRKNGLSARGRPLPETGLIDEARWVEPPPVIEGTSEWNELETEADRLTDEPAQVALEIDDVECQGFDQPETEALSFATLSFGMRGPSKRTDWRRGL